MNAENISHVTGNEAVHPLVGSSTLPAETNCWQKAQCCPAALISRWHLWQVLQREIALSVLWKTHCTILTPTVDQLPILICMYSWWPTTHLCQLTVALSLNVASSDQTVKSGKVSCDLHKPQSSIGQSVLSLFIAQSSLGAYGFHFLCYKMRLVLVLGTPISLDYCLWRVCEVL